MEQVIGSVKCPLGRRCPTNLSSVQRLDRFPLPEGIDWRVTWLRKNLSRVLDEVVPPSAQL